MWKACPIFVSIIFSFNVYASEAAFDVKLNPAGDFKGRTSEVDGVAIVNGTKVTAENIKVKLKNVKTGVALRDSHTLKHLEAEKFPEVILIKGEGENGKGKGLIEIKGIKKEIAGTYKVQGSEVLAEFPLKLSDFNITGIKYMGIGVEDQIHVHVTVPAKAGALASAPTAKPAAAPKTQPAASKPVVKASAPAKSVSKTTTSKKK